MKLTMRDVTKQRDVLEKSIQQGGFVYGVIKWLDLEEEGYKTLILFAGDEPVTIMSVHQAWTSWNIMLMETGNRYRKQYYGVSALLYLFDFEDVRQVPTGEKPHIEKAPSNLVIDGEATWDSVKFWRHIGADVDDNDEDEITFKLSYDKFSDYLEQAIKYTTTFGSVK